jgi:hypothetical protein
MEGLRHSTRFKGGNVCKVSCICRLTTARLSGRVRNVSKEAKCYTATTFFLCETHYRKSTAGYGGVAVWWSNMVPRSSPGGIVEAEQTYQLEGRAVFGGCTVLGDRVWVCVGAGKCGGRYRGEISARPKGWLEGSGDEVFEGRWPEEKEWDIG